LGDLLGTEDRCVGSERAPKGLNVEVIGVRVCDRGGGHSSRLARGCEQVLGRLARVLGELRNAPQEIYH
jgi:hypothetical protein